MGQRWIKCYGDATSIPGAAPTNYFNGINIPGGPIQSIMIRLEMVAAAQVAATDVSIFPFRPAVTHGSSLVSRYSVQNAGTHDGKPPVESASTIQTGADDQ